MPASSGGVKRCVKQDVAVGREGIIHLSAWEKRETTLQYNRPVRASRLNSLRRRTPSDARFKHYTIARYAYSGNYFYENSLLSCFITTIVHMIRDGLETTR